ncbi:hypothetical protein ACRYWZ_08370 [Agrobacterium deltaense]|uniref:hypothetical protein n=1 Tax=Agrobacterium deltaense TaxID=1183412 RepID=UPI003D989D77
MKVDLKKSYMVKLSRPVKRGAFTLRPLNEIEMKGPVLAEIIDAEGEDVIDYARAL